MSSHLIFIIVGLMTPFVVSKPFYRKDYTYIEAYNAFYKVHWDLSGLSWSDAFQACYDEGAKLFYPSKADEWTIVKNLTTTMPVMPNTTEIYVGLHDEFSLGEFVTVDGTPTETPLNVEEYVTSSERCVLMDFTTGGFRVDSCIRDDKGPAAFVCKRVEENSCPTIDHEYKYLKDVKKCYKVNTRPKTWKAAMETCYMEGGTLAIFDYSRRLVEHLALDNSQNYFIGFRRMFHSADFYTVNGAKLENDDFRNSYRADENVGRDCGVCNQNLRKDVDNCDTKLPFICEMVAK